MLLLVLGAIPLIGAGFAGYQAHKCGKLKERIKKEEEKRNTPKDEQ